MLRVNIFLYLCTIKFTFMDIYEKAGDLVINLAKFVFGGVILASIISANVNTSRLYTGAAVTIVFIIGGFLLYRLQKKKTII